MKNKIFAIVLFALFALSYGFQYSGSTPPPKGSLMKINIIDKDTGAFVPGNLSVRIEYAAPNQAKNYEYTAPVTASNEEINLGMPPAEYAVTARIKATAAGYYESADELAITSEQYWNNVLQGKDTSAWGADVEIAGSTGIPPEPEPDTAQKSYVAEHTFKLKKMPPPPKPAIANKTSETSGNETTSNASTDETPSKGCLPFFIVAALLCYAAGRKK